MTRDRRNGDQGSSEGRQSGTGAGMSPGKRTLTGSIALKRMGPGAGPRATPAVADALEQPGPGAPLAGDVQAGVARVTGADVSDARVHTGPTAAAAAESLDARAFTMGDDIYLGAGEHASDRSLMTHEAAHVAQQGAGGAARPQAKSLEVIPEGDASEQEADRVADAVTSGAELTVPLSAPPDGVSALARKPKNHVTTPDGLPEQQPAESLAPGSSEERLDGEGNKIAENGGHWHLTEKPRSISFPIKAGYKPQLLPINPNASYGALLAACQAIRGEQLAAAKGLKGDMKYWFAKVYTFVTTRELQFIAAGKYQYPHMKLQEVIAFHTTYSTNLENWKAGNKNKVEAQWKAAFGAAEGQNGGSWHIPRSKEILNSLLPSMEAHIRIDLPRAIAACFVTHYEGIPGTSMGDFRPDFDAMGPVFDLATEDIRPEIEAEATSIDPGNIDWLGEAGFPFLFNVPMERDHAWEKAGNHKGFMPGGSNADARKRLKSHMGTAHPNSGQDSFEVDGTDVRNRVDWVNQPGMKQDKAAPAPKHEAAPEPPAFPEKLFFKHDRPKEDETLERCIRDDQDLAPFVALAEWTRQVRHAQIHLEGSASAEGPEWHNKTLAHARAGLVEYFLFKVGADTTHNTFTSSSKGEERGEERPESRYVRILILAPGTGRQQHHVPNTNLPGEVQP